MPNHPGPIKDSVIPIAYVQPCIRRKHFFTDICHSFLGFYARHRFASLKDPGETARLDRGWIIANHKLVSFHAAFLTSLLSIPLHVSSKFAVMREMFLSVEVVISSVIWYAAWHTNIAIHEMGHYLTAVKTNNLRPELAASAEKKLAQGGFRKWRWYLEMFVKIPYGAFRGVHKRGGQLPSKCEDAEPGCFRSRTEGE